MAAPASAPASDPQSRLSGAGGSRRASVHGSVMSAQGTQTHGEDLWSLTVRLVSAADLMTADLFTRSSDPYAKLLLDDAPESKRKSKVIKKSLAPEWGETITWVSSHKPAMLSVEIKDWESIGHHDSLGTARIPLDAITGGQAFEGELALEGHGIKHGRVTLRVDAMPIPNIVGRSTDELRGVKAIEDIVSLIDLKVCSADNLGGKSNHGAFKKRFDPFATVSFGLHHFKTAVVPRCNNPIWEQLCPLWTTYSDNNANSILKISVFDFEHLTSARLLGHAYIKPANLKVNHRYDVKLPLTLDGATTDAQLTVLMRDLAIDRVSTLPHADVNAAAAAEGATSGALPENDGTSTPASNAAAELAGSIHVQFTIKPRDLVESEFYRHLISDYDADGSNTMDLVEITHMLTALGIKKLTEADILESFALADASKTNALGVAELAVLFRTPNFERHGVLKQLYAVITYGAGALDSLLMKGCLTGSNINLEPDADPTVDNEGTRIMVQDRETGMVVQENIPAYIKSALVLLNRTWMGKMASGRIKGTLRTLTKRQGVKMDSPSSAKDIPNFVKIHQLNLSEVEHPISHYHTFNHFFYRRLKKGARKCASPDDASLAVSPADARMMVFRSLEDSKRLWIKGESFSVGNLFAGWDSDGSKAQLFNGGELVIARLAPQDYHRFHWPVSGTLLPRYLILGEYHTVSPIAVRKNVDVYTENKRCICPIQTDEFGLVVLIAIAATMVGSIGFPCVCNPPPAGGAACCDDGRCMVGKRVSKFDDAGFFAFGGSTTLVLFQPGTIHFDSDLVQNSERQLETLVKVGMSLGRATGKGAAAAAAAAAAQAAASAPKAAEAPDSK